MSQRNDSEDDIWDYKPLGKKKKKGEPASAGGTVAKRRCTASRKTQKTSSVPRNDGVNVVTEELHLLDAPEAHSEASCEDFCPVCQMPFSILVVQTQRWHVSECLDSPRDSCKECPDGLQCSSSIPNHYKKFNHTLLAHNRANSDGFFTPSKPAHTRGETSHGFFPELLNNEVDDSSLETSQENPRIMSPLKNHVASPVSNHTGTPPSKPANSLLFLRSPGPEDLKKKKGWSSSTKGQKAISASQESKTEVSSTPLQENSTQACEGLSECDFSPHHDAAISYSPLSEFPAEAEVALKSEPRKALFKSDAFENDDDSMVLFSSEDELLADFIDDLESKSSQVEDAFLSNSQVETVTSLAATQPASSSAATDRADSTGEDGKLLSLQSPQSAVLERLRETLQKSEQSGSHQSPSSQIMAPQKGLAKPAQAPGLLKQTDIGVFFGLKPLKEKEKEAAGRPEELAATASAALSQNPRKEGQRRERRGRQRKSDAPAGSSQAAETDAGEAANAQGKPERRGTGEFRRRRWNRWNKADGVEELPRCPFYKKIPGTTFTIDAFGYGQIEGITAYFLTHFHSDHYGGLTKNSTRPIYCNKITGNLVKSKLRVAEKYVHILPMNTEVTVDGVRVIFLDANHCPGAAMLLFFLPDGQTVLHTGDFRADPSMETYPELLNCRVQTLYLDTTYCNPQYTFPHQQEVISFAASTAFELVTLHPRTLVVCGSYSVGKEKVFLALAEVLGSKVCLSRDKYNTMCCLESEQIKQRLTTDWKAAKVHVLPMMQLTFKKLEDHLARFSAQYDQLVAFKPTGWTFSQGNDSVADIEPQVSGRVSIYGIPYSEHSSFLELKRFVQWLQPLKIIPTVNNGSWASRKAMDKFFSEWRSEAKARPYPVT